jgi:hypothetical protein
MTGFLNEVVIYISTITVQVRIREQTTSCDPGQKTQWWTARRYILLTSRVPVHRTVLLLPRSGLPRYVLNDGLAIILRTSAAKHAMRS